MNSQIRQGRQGGRPALRRKCITRSGEIEQVLPESNRSGPTGRANDKQQAFLHVGCACAASSVDAMVQIFGAGDIFARQAYHAPDAQPIDTTVHQVRAFGRWMIQHLLQLIERSPHLGQPLVRLRGKSNFVLGLITHEPDFKRIVCKERHGIAFQKE